MYSRSKYCYISLILLITNPISLSAQDICNNTNTEQIITDGENEQYIPPHMCITVSNDSSEIVEENTTEEQVQPIVVETNTQEVTTEVEKQKEEKPVEEPNEQGTEEQSTTQKDVQEDNKQYKNLLLIPPIIVVLVIAIRKFR